VSVQLTPDQQRKVALINSTLGLSDDRLKNELSSIETFARDCTNPSLNVFGCHGYYDDLAGYTPEWPARVRSVHDELLRARDRLDSLNTGLRAERLLSAALGEAAAAFGDLAAGLSSNDQAVIEQKIASMEGHWTTANAIATAALTSLEHGR
jgi:hypothetical protein